MIFTIVYAQEEIKLLSIPVVKAPVIEKKTIRLNVYFVFDTCTHEYWIHYNRENGRLIIEFFGTHINAPPLKIKGTKALGDPTFTNNSETDLALNGRSAQISMPMQNGWHYESKILGGKVLHLQLWMLLNPGKMLMSKRKNLLLPMMLTVLGVAAVTFLMIEIFSDSGD